ncbi:MAG: hypothetical protein K2L37_00185 [Lactobacillus sp.]|nr:hypothetical protein [Lactobacillus sp.]
MENAIVIPTTKSGLEKKIGNATLKVILGSNDAKFNIKYLVKLGKDKRRTTCKDIH